MAADPQDMRGWWEVAGAFVAGLLGLRGVQVLRGSKDASIEDLVAVIQREHSETRRVLHELDTRIQVLAAVLEDSRLERLRRDRS